MGALDAAWGYFSSERGCAETGSIFAVAVKFGVGVGMGVGVGVVGDPFLMW
ncbi:hypothetical protein Ancab_002489 [Ancistrocladus abbreviatus]